MKVVSFLLRSVMVALTIIWLGLILLNPLKTWEDSKNVIASKTTGQYFGRTGFVYVLYSAPIFLIVIIGSIYIRVTQFEKRKRPSAIWSYPAIIKGPLGTLTMKELLVTIIVVFILLWTAANYIINDLVRVQASGPTSWTGRWAIVAGRMGSVGLLCVVFLLFPVTRVSVLLQLVNLSFERTVKYHIWIGTVAMTCFSIHGFSFMAIWIMNGKFIEEIFSWNKVGLSMSAGAISLLAGLVMLATSFKTVRHRWFEVFHYTHHLYIVFLVFMLMHIGEASFSITFPGLFLFCLDRFLRMLQSRKNIHIIKATKMPSNLVRLVVAKNPNLKYSPTSLVFLNIPAISKLEWHPFSIISRSCIDKTNFSLVIKCHQSWTAKLEKHIAHSSASGNNQQIEARIEGPYGPAYSEFLGYDSIILVGGGSGITPLLSIMSEMLYQHEITNGGVLPNEVVLLWAVREAEELGILSLVVPSKICPNFHELVKLEIDAYVTRPKPSDTEMVYLGMAASREEVTVPTTTSRAFSVRSDTASLIMGTPHPNSVMSITSMNNVLGLGTIVVVSLGGFFFMMALFNHYYINPIDHNTYAVFPWWRRGLIFLLCMALGVCIFGGLAYILWMWKKSLCSTPLNDFQGQDDDANEEQEAFRDSLLTNCTVHQGQSPDFNAMIGRLSRRMAGRNVGVIVSGPERLKHTVAQACRQHGRFLGTGSGKYASLSFSSLSFEF